MKIAIVKDKERAAMIREAIKKNDGYCPCSFIKDEDTRCMCKEFREQDNPGLCRCGLYEKVEAEKSPSV